MSLLTQFIRTYTTFFLVSYLTIYTNEVHAQAASDYFWLDEITTVKPLEDSTSEGDFKDLEQSAIKTDDFKRKKETTTTATYTSRASGCGFPPRLDYAQPKDSFLGQTTFSKGSTVTYICRPGYSRIPGVRSFATCMNDGTWSPPGIICKRRACGNPGEVENSEMTADNFLFGSKVTYVCNSGYKMVTRRNYRECQADGTWSNAIPICEAQLCPPPPNIINGAVSPLKEEYTYLDSVTYTCIRNLALIGESSISCKEDGQWSSNAPECRVVNCFNPHVLNARKIYGGSGPYNLNSVVRFRCTSDYVLNGSDTIKCNQNSEWEPAFPRCLALCKYVPVIEYAELVEPTRENVFVEGTTLQFKCKKGFNPVPDKNNVLTCLGRSWTQPQKFCTPISCEDPGPISNGHINGGTYFFGSGVIYECNLGYTIVDHNYRSCQADGNWSLPIPKCEVKTCPYPNSTAKTSFIPLKTEYQYGDKLRYSCGEGYELIGGSESSCNHEGRWSPDLPTCRGICHAPPELTYAIPNHTFLDKKTFFQYEEVLYTCRKGYTPKQHYKNTLMCLGNFEWSHPVQFCSRISCGRPEEVKNAVYNVTDFLFGSEAVYKCETGYNMVSENNIRTCLDNKKWSDSVPECEVQTCQSPEDLVNGSYSIKKERYTYLDSVTYKCDSLTLVGEASVSCTAEGDWTSRAPECKAVCKSPPELKYGELVETFPKKQYFNVGTSLKYKCQPGYIFTENTSDEITCLPDLKWSEPEVFCKRLSCGKPGDITHGQMQFKDFLFESRVNYTCTPGYTMISRRNYRYCQADGTWNGTSPVCKASICDHIWELQEEARKCTSTPDEWIKYLQVQYLYLQIENLKLDIDIKKRKLSADKTQ